MWSYPKRYYKHGGIRAYTVTRCFSPSGACGSGTGVGVGHRLRVHVHSDIGQDYEEKRDILHGFLLCKCLEDALD
jgi:Xaa-Pro aminopeptidase